MFPICNEARIPVKAFSVELDPPVTTYPHRWIWWTMGSMIFISAIMLTSSERWSFIPNVLFLAVCLTVVTLVARRLNQFLDKRMTKRWQENNGYQQAEILRYVRKCMWWKEGEWVRNEKNPEITRCMIQTIGRTKGYIKGEIYVIENQFFYRELTSAALRFRDVTFEWDGETNEWFAVLKTPQASLIARDLIATT